MVFKSKDLIENMTDAPNRVQVDWSLVVAANSDQILRSNLLANSESAAAKEVLIQKDALSAAHAYNRGLQESTGEIVVFAHQDVFLPPGWHRRFSRAIMELSRRDPNWGVAGLYGVKRSGRGVGYAYSTGLRRFVGQEFSSPTHVRTLDEIMLVVRRKSGLSFDPDLPGFHLYGTDICLEAEARGMKNYVLPCFALHNSAGLKYLPLDFWKAYIYLRRKWITRLPIVTPCTKITRCCMPMFKDILYCGFLRPFRDHNSGSRVSDPARLYAENLMQIVNKREKN